MGLKLIAILFLVVGAIYAAPAVDDELEDTQDEELADPTELDEESLDALTEEDDEEDQDEDAMDEEDPKKKKPKRKSCPAVLKGKKGFRPLVGFGQYCVCKAPSKAKGDEAEISEDDVEEHVESLAEDPKRKKKLSKKQKAKLFHNLIKNFFRRSDKCCYCVYNRRVVRLLVYLHKVHIMALKGKYMFYLHFRRLVTAAVGRRKAAAYFRALRRG